MPYRIHRRDSEPFAFAGIWNEGSDAADVGSVASITTEPNRLMAPIHDRMPVILHEDDYGRWLEGSNQADVAALLVPSPAGELDAYPVSTLVNTPRNDIPAVIEPQTPTP